MPALYRHKWIYLESKAGVSMLTGQTTVIHNTVLEESACVLNVVNRIEFRVCHVTKIMQVIGK